MSMEKAKRDFNFLNPDFEFDIPHHLDAGIDHLKLIPAYTRARKDWHVTLLIFERTETTCQFVVERAARFDKSLIRFEGTLEHRNESIAHCRGRVNKPGYLPYILIAALSLIPLQWSGSSMSQ